MPKVVRVSILRSPPDRFERLAAMMRDAEVVLRPGIEALPGLIAFWSGIDAAALALSNVSVWNSLDDALQMDAFAPMRELAKSFAAEGAIFERPILNLETMWSLKPNAE